jgi:GntR family transcriptional regulator
VSDDGLGAELLHPIDPASPVPRYRQISDQIATLVLDVRPGVRLPSEYEIVSRLGVSRATATQALRDLEQRGLVYRRQGRGTFVADTDRAIRTNQPGILPSFSEDLRKAGRSTRERVIALEIVPARDEVASALNVLDGDDVWRVERVIVSDDEPVVHVTSWLPCAVFSTLTRAAIEASSLYEQLATIDGSPGRPCFADEHWSAAPAPTTTAPLLELAPGMPVMRVVRTAYLHDQTPAEYVISYVRGETFAVSIRIDSHNHGGRVLSQLAASAE